MIIQRTEGRAHFTVAGVALDDAQYDLTLRWNGTDESWYMDVDDGDGQRITSGLRVVLGVYFGRQSTHKLFLRGAFFVVDTSNAGREATFDDLGSRVVLSYWLHTELTADMVAQFPGGSASALPELE